MDSNLYILDEKGRPKLEPDLLTWGAWFEQAERRIAHTKDRKGNEVVTVFLGINMSGPTNMKKLLIWETGCKVDGQWLQGIRSRARPWALEQHQYLVDKHLKPPLVDLLAEEKVSSPHA